MDQRTYGVEIEFLSRVGGQTIIDGLNTRFQNANIDFVASQNRPFSYDSRTWVLGHDGSISGLGWGFNFSFELKSPKLKGKDSFRALRIVCDYLQGIGKVNNSCGLHVHHGIESREQAEKIGRVWIKIEDLIFDCLPETRKANGYCARWNRETYRDDDGKIEHAFYDRRLALNLKAFRQHGTVEFRCLEGSLDYVTISNWVMVTKGIINIALSKDDQPVVSTIKAFQNILYTEVAEIVEETTSSEDIDIETVNDTDYEAIRLLKHSPRSPIVKILDRLISSGQYNFHELVSKVHAELPEKSLVTIRTYINRSRNHKYNRLKTRVIVENGIYKFANASEVSATPKSTDQDIDQDIIITTVTKRKVDKLYQIACQWLENRYSLYCTRRQASFTQFDTNAGAAVSEVNAEEITWEDCRETSGNVDVLDEIAQINAHIARTDSSRARMARATIEEVERVREELRNQDF